MADGNDKELAKALMAAFDALVETKVKDKYWDGEKIMKRIDELTELYQRYSEQHTFKPGMLVRWKLGLKNKKRPEYNEPAVVVNVLLNPILDTSEGAGSPYYRERLDLMLGLIDSDGDFVIFHFDQQRFEPMPTPLDDR